MRSEHFLDNVNEAVRDNPVAAGLIGLGLAWMLFSKSRAVVGTTSRAARASKDTLDTAVDVATGAIGSTVVGAVDQIRKATAGVSDAVSGGMKAAASTVGVAMEGSETATKTPDKRTADSGNHSRPFRSGLADLLDRQPLALAAVAVAVGAVIASAFPSTGTEERLMGTAGEKLRETVKGAAETAGDRVATAIAEATDEAVAQDLTPDAFKKAARGNAAKLKRVAEAGLEAVKK
ncbi:hypothetical protein G5V57_16760 [Nordella sp. HKS 07]|uniref:hypothetical protein n=1 Tax=Nordella sp. HKS 07 TaxID=2712222 RepID=UPI0013E19783|nr:hypothetical protein [Nordella sp. HKS 07]QIG49222.1 hypothetical protein G5V57_16760 [Nordella sp. HKS 07]